MYIGAHVVSASARRRDTNFISRLKLRRSIVFSTALCTLLKLRLLRYIAHQHARAVWRLRAPDGPGMPFDSVTRLSSKNVNVIASTLHSSLRTLHFTMRS